MTENKERHVYTLMSLNSEFGVAMTCVGILGIEKNAGQWSQSIEWIEGFLNASDGGWPDRLGPTMANRSLDVSDMEELMETSNGVMWDLWEIDPLDYESATSLSDAVEIVMYEVLETTAEPRNSLLASGLYKMSRPEKEK